MLNDRLQQYMPELTKRLYTLYGDRWDFYQILQKIVSIITKADTDRDQKLKERDEADYTAKTSWYLSEKNTGIMLYTDLFADNFEGLKKRISYLKKLGITYVHIMPPFASPAKENDGGYAVSSYRKTDKKLGSIQELKEVAELFHQNNIRLVVDFVFNHTSDEHEWAKKAKKGDPFYKDFYFIYPDKAEADSWNATLREIFPEVRRGSFTFVKEAGGWVWTTFNSFQWDLNYHNPEVFLAMCQEMLFLANIGADVLRLDALAFVWKEKGTCCESLDKAHTLIQAFHYVAAIAVPALLFKSEAIVHPDEVIRYISPGECALSYNPLQMALFWEALATRKTRLLTESLTKRWHTPANCAWVNYLRCHDDIGWTFSDEDAASIGINGYTHRQFLNKFYTGQFPGSFAKGEPFQLNPVTGDCRVCGTLASLAGLEQAFDLLNSEDPQQQSFGKLYVDMAARRIRMLYGAMLALPGIPLLYAGDEHAVLNDYSYQKDKKKQNDSRWVHRIKYQKELPENVINFSNADISLPVAFSKSDDVQEILTRILWSLIHIRQENEGFAGQYIEFHAVQNEHVFAFKRNGIQIIANFSETPTVFYIPYGESHSYYDLLSGNRYTGNKQELEPYAIRWLKEV